MTESGARATQAAKAEVRNPGTDPAGAPASAEPGGTDGETRAEAAQPDLLAEARREAAEYKDRLLRTLAEMENLRRRTEREVTDVRHYGIASFARDILAVADNMDRALQALDHEIREKVDSGVKALLDGVELTERELHKVLEKHGVRKFEPKGEKFDPNRHQAMYEVADPALPPGTVAQVIQAGYTIGERVLRPALVAVAKAQPQPAVHEAPANDNA
ncbi:MAG TPA: nucleotide exchange factor GrpE [Xanthobacteraceae bacterium]